MTEKSKENILAVDIGGSHITASIVHSSENVPLQNSVRRRSIDSHASANGIIAVWLELLTEVMKKATSPCSTMAISMPGPFDYKGGISLIKGMNKYEALYGLDLKHIFAEGLGLSEDRIIFVNDAEAFLRGEVSCLSIKEKQFIMGMTIGTGLGSARHCENIVTDLNLGSAPFLDGISEDYISTRGLLNYYQKIGGSKAHDVFSLTQLVDTDGAARKTLIQLGIWLADFLKIYLPVIGADHVILGGNISKAHAHFLPMTLSLLRDFTFQVSLAKLGEQAPMIGAATYANNLFSNDLF